jgi:hypothetical protein
MLMHYKSERKPDGSIEMVSVTERLATTTTKMQLTTEPTPPTPTREKSRKHQFEN